MKDAANLTLRRRKLYLRGRELRLSHAKPVDTSSKTMKTSQPERNSGKKAGFASRTPEANTNFSYQGLHASKSGGQKKVLTKISSRSATKPKSEPANEYSSGKKKRPAVALRKQKELRAAKASTLAGTKRKLGNPSPDSGGQKKKARKIR